METQALREDKREIEEEKVPEKKEKIIVLNNYFRVKEGEENKELPQRWSRVCGWNYC
jgi:hypothetical protein